MGKKSADDVIERLKLALGASNDSDLCRITGVNRQTLGNWKSRDSVPYSLCVQISEDKNLSLDWLLTGVGEMRKGTASAQGPALSPKEESILALFNALSAADQREILAAAETKKQIKDKLDELDALIAQQKITG